MYQKINDYGIIGNLQTIALVSMEGSINWLCLPHLDSPSVFAALLDERIGGRFQLHPEGDADTVQVYRSQTNVLTTRFRRRDGARMELTDFMPMPNSEDDAGTVYRKIEVLKGAMRVKLTLAPGLQGRASRPEITIEADAKRQGSVVPVISPPDRLRPSEFRGRAPAEPPAPSCRRVTIGS